MSRVSKTPADKAVAHLLRRILDSPRLAYYFHMTEGLDLLLAAHSEAHQVADVVKFRADFDAKVRTEEPRCSQCPHCQNIKDLKGAD